MLVVINYANGTPYEDFRKWNTWSAKHFGMADDVWEYSEKEISVQYKKDTNRFLHINVVQDCGYGNPI